MIDEMAPRRDCSTLRRCYKVAALPADTASGQGIGTIRWCSRGCGATGLKPPGRAREGGLRLTVEGSAGEVPGTGSGALVAQGVPRHRLDEGPRVAGDGVAQGAAGGGNGAEA